MPIRRNPRSILLIVVLQVGMLLTARNPCTMLADCGGASASARPMADCHGGPVLSGSAADCCGDACATAPAKPLLSRTASPGTPEIEAAGIAPVAIHILPAIAVVSTPTTAPTARGRPPIHLLLHALLI